MRTLKQMLVPASMAFVLLSACAFAQTPSSKSTPLTGPGSIAGLWLKSGYRNLSLASLRTPERDKVQRTIDGEWPPLQPWASDELELRIKKSQEGDPILTTQAQCLPGIPVMLLGGGAYPIQILETPGQVTMLFEEMNHFRLIHLNSEHPKDLDPTYMGDSVGHWEGNALVVDTVSLNEKTPIDWLGMSHSAQLHLIERYRRTDKDTLELVMTIDDPKTFTKRWDVKQVFRAAPADRGLTEYICENNRDVPDKDN